MSLTEGSAHSSSPQATALGEVLTFFGAVADYAASRAPEDGERIASMAVSMAQMAGLSQEETDALYFAARLRNVGALGNPAFAKGEPLSERALMMNRWDIPPDGARICARIGALPGPTADILRWQGESWDGTGFPDQMRWSGIPKAAQLLHIATSYVTGGEPEEALTTVTFGSGRDYAPEHARTFVMWYHTYGGEIESVPAPFSALRAEPNAVRETIWLISQRVDAHNGTPGRGERIAKRAEEIARRLKWDEPTVEATQLASLLFAIGELRAADLESSQFDALARLGIETRAEHAVAAARLIEQCPYLSEVAPVVRARAEWYDGTGGPSRLRHDAIPRPAQALAVSIAYDGLDEVFRSRITEERTMPISRLETAAGTQFDPQAVRALGEVIKADT